MDLQSTVTENEILFKFVQKALGGLRHMSRTLPWSEASNQPNDLLISEILEISKVHSQVYHFKFHPQLFLFSIES